MGYGARFRKQLTFSEDIQQKCPETCGMCDALNTEFRHQATLLDFIL